MLLKNLSRLDQDKILANWLESHPDPNDVIREILNDYDIESRYVQWLNYRDEISMIPLFDHIRSALIDIIESEDDPFKPYTGSPLDVIKQHAEDVKK